MFKVDIPDPTDASVVADWVELSVVYTKSPISKAQLESKINAESGDETSDAFISSVWDILDRRSFLYGDIPPFIVEGLDVNPNIDWESNPEYLMLLILSLTGNPSNPTATGKLFERVSKEAVKNYMDGDAIVFGHPSRISIRNIAQTLQEGFKQELPTNYNDRGVDVIAWKPFNDGRGNQLIAFIQCAGGANWTSKTGDVVMRAWAERYMTFHCTPVRGFTTVVVIDDAERFQEVSFETDLLLDRLRIYRYTVNKQLENNLRNEIKMWCDNRITEIVN
jgi:hypothetical protein